MPAAAYRARMFPPVFNTVPDTNFTIGTPVRRSDKYLPINVRRQAIPLNVMSGDVPFRLALHPSAFPFVCLIVSTYARERKISFFPDHYLSYSFTIIRAYVNFLLRESIILSSSLVNVARIVESIIFLRDRDLPYLRSFTHETRRAANFCTMY